MPTSKPIVRDFTLFQGGAWNSGTLTARDGDGTVINLTGATVRMHICSSPGGAKYLEQTYAVVTAASGTFTFSLTGRQTTDSSLRVGVYDIEVELSGVEYKTHIGKIRILTEITRETES